MKTGMTAQEAGRVFVALGRAAAKTRPEFEALLAERRRREPIAFLLADLRAWIIGRR